MIINTIIPSYENRNLPTTFTYASPAIKYIYPKKYGYNKTSLLYPAPFPFYKKPSSYSTGLEGLLYQRQEVIDSKIQMVLTEINQRRILKDENLYKIDLDQCTCLNLIYHIGKDYKDKRRVDIEKKIIDLEEEKRREKTTYFRDILFLRKELRESFIEKLEEDQKADIFITKQEEIPCCL
ncbi:MAG: hypothetical protein NTX62_01975 [Deltaproteobacteria bacterium]|nr:hypothetical protein [Deltaproteobacteria bacterium]